MLNKPWRNHEADADEQFESNNSGLIIMYSTNQLQYRQNNEALSSLLEKAGICFEDMSDSVAILDKPHFFDQTGLPVLILNRQFVLSYAEAIKLINSQPSNGTLMFNGVDYNYFEKKRRSMTEQQQEAWLKSMIPFTEIPEEEEADAD